MKDKYVYIQIKAKECMPNRWERINGVLTPKLARASVQAEDKQVLTDYSTKDDFDHATSPTDRYTVTGTWSSVATGSNFVSGTVAGNSGGIIGPAGGAVDATKKIIFKATCTLTDADTELFAYIGLAETAPTDADPPVEADDFIGFTLVETTLDVNWQAHTATDLGTTESVIDTGIVVSLTTHDYEIDLENSEAVFKIDGVEVARQTATLPVATTLKPVIKVTTGDTAAKGVTVDVLSLVNTR